MEHVWVTCAWEGPLGRKDAGIFSLYSCTKVTGVGGMVCRSEQDCSYLPYPWGILLNDSIFLWTGSSTQMDGACSALILSKRHNILCFLPSHRFWQLFSPCLGCLAGLDLLLSGSSVGTQHTQHIISACAPQPEHHNHSLLKYLLALYHSLVRVSGGPDVLEVII